MKKLEEMRRRNGMTQAELGKRLGVDQTTVSKWEHGKANPSFSKIPEIAKVLECEIGELFQDRITNLSQA